MPLGTQVHRFNREHVAAHKKAGKAAFPREAHLKKELLSEKANTGLKGRDLCKEAKGTGGKPLLEGASEELLAQIAILDKPLTNEYDEKKLEEIDAEILDTKQQLDAIARNPTPEQKEVAKGLEKTKKDLEEKKADLQPLRELKEALQTYEKTAENFNKKADGTPQATGTQTVELALKRTQDECLRKVKAATEAQARNLQNKFNEKEYKANFMKYAKITEEEYKAFTEAALANHKTAADKNIKELEEEFKKQLDAIHKAGNQHAQIQSLFEQMAAGGVAEETAKQIADMKKNKANPGPGLVIGHNGKVSFESDDLKQLKIIKSITNGIIEQKEDGTTFVLKEPSSLFGKIRYHLSPYQNQKTDLMLMAAACKAAGVENLKIKIEPQKNREKAFELARLAVEAAAEAGYDLTKPKDPKEQRKVSVQIGEESFDFDKLYKGFEGSLKALEELSAQIDKEEKIPEEVSPGEEKYVEEVQRNLSR
jgi:hypothetical protein